MGDERRLCAHSGLLHVQRHLNNNQYVYSCGWIIDDSCLYENSTTVLTGRRLTESDAGNVRFITAPTPEGRERIEDHIKRSLPDDVSSIGAQLFDATMDDAVQAESHTSE